MTIRHSHLKHLLSTATGGSYRVDAITDPRGVRCVIASSPDLPENPVLRLHSACLFGEVLGSVECDCAQQLSAALGMIESDGGILVYLDQEGRGAGLHQKIAAMSLEHENQISTAEAYGRLGLPSDVRDYREALSFVRDSLGVRRARLMTNNPLKMAAVAEAGIEIDERLEPHLTVTAKQHAYVCGKAVALGHIPYSNMTIHEHSE